MMAKRLQHLPTQLLHALGEALDLGWAIHKGHEIDITSDIDPDSAWRRFQNFIRERVDVMGMPSSMIPGRLTASQATGEGVAQLMTKALMKLFGSPWFFGCKADCGETWTEHIRECYTCQLRIVRFADGVLSRVTDTADKHFYLDFMSDLQDRHDIKLRVAAMQRRRSTDAPIGGEARA